MPLRLAALLVALLLGLPGFSSLASAGPVRVERIDGKLIEGDLGGIEGDVASVRSADGSRHEVPLRRIVALTFPAPERPLATPEDSVEILLVGGGRLIGTVLGGDDRVVKTGSISLGSRAIPLDALAGLRYVDRLGGLDGVRPETGSDVIYIKGSGDRLTGTLATFERGALRFDCDVAADYRVPLERLAALFLDNPPPLPREGIVTAIRLHDGSRLQGTDLKYDGVAIRLRPAYPGFEEGDAWTIPVEAVAHLTFGGGDYVHLADLADKWTATVVPFFPPADAALDPSKWLAPRTDEAFRGGTLRLGGVPRAKGVAVVSGTTIEIPLDGLYESFQALVGVDDGAGPHGNVTFEVRLDGALKWKCAHATGQAPVKTPVIPLGDAKKLQLRVGYGDEKSGDVQDFADWVDALLVKKG